MYLKQCFNFHLQNVADPLLDFGITDADSGSNANITVSISDSANISSMFTISGHQLYVDGTQLDFEALNNNEYRYLLTVIAKDNPYNEKQMSNLALVIVKVQRFRNIISSSYLL